VRRVTLVAYRAFSDLAGKGSFLLITVAAAHRLSQRAFGIFALASALGWIVSVVTDCGIQLHVARAVAWRPADAPVLLRTWLEIRLWTAGAAMVVTAAGLLALAPPRDDAITILLFALLYMVSGLIEFLHYFYRGLTRSDVESSLTLWQRLATLGAALLALAWSPDPILLATAMLVPVVITFLVSVRIATRLGRETAARPSTLSPEPSALSPQPLALSPEPSPLPGAKGSSGFRRDVLPIGVGIVLSALYFRIDVFLVQYWLGTESVALYNAVFRLVEALRLFPAAVLAVVLPSLCRADDGRPLLRVSFAVTAFAMATTLVLWVNAGWGIPLLYGTRYAAGVPAFRILTLSFPLLSLNYALTHQLIGWEGQRAYAMVCGVALVANVALNARLIPALSIEGAAWATFWTEAVMTAGCGFALWRRGVRRISDPLAVTAAS
jgi:O-antigen/teichoic acid export membrane protein